MNRELRFLPLTSIGGSLRKYGAGGGDLVQPGREWRRALDSGYVEDRNDH